jgi:hypothetical protein
VEISHLKNSIFSCSLSENQNTVPGTGAVKMGDKSIEIVPDTSEIPVFTDTPSQGI